LNRILNIWLDSKGCTYPWRGTQDKLPVVFAEGRIGLPSQNTPSSRILDPALAAVEGSIFNEGLSLALAEHLKTDAELHHEPRFVQPAPENSSPNLRPSTTRHFPSRTKTWPHKRKRKRTISLRKKKGW